MRKLGTPQFDLCMPFTWTNYLRAKNQVRLSHRGLSPYELSAALRHVLESYKSQRHQHHKPSTTSASVAKSARQATLVPAAKGDSPAAGSPGEAEADATNPTVLLPGEMEGNAPAPTAGLADAGRDNTNEGRTVAFAETEGGPGDVVGSAAAAAASSAAEAEKPPAQTHGRVGGGGSAVSPAAATAAAAVGVASSSTEKLENGTTGGGAAEFAAKPDQAPRSAFAEQDWRALEPDLAQFCHKVRYEQLQ